MLENILMQKAGLATQNVARVLVGLEPGDRVPTVTELSERFDTARGNIQFALTNLKKLGAIELKARGHLGTFLVRVNYLTLAEVCGVKGIVGAMPLPYSKKYEGLATGLYSSLNKGEITANIAFMRGSKNRLGQLMAGRYDFVVMSRLACLNYQQEGYEIDCLASFGPHTYVDRHVVIVREDFDGSWQGKRVGVDESSIDHHTLTQQTLGGKGVVFEPMMYNQILPRLHSGEIDACVWNADGMEDFKGIQVVQEDLDTSASEAVLACRAEDSLTRRLVQQTLDKALVCTQQLEVLHGQRVPRY